MAVVLLVLLVAFVIGGALITGLGGIIAIGSVSRDEKRRASLDPDRVLNELFDGDLTVTYRVLPSTLPFEAVVSGGVERGYALEGQSDGVLVFRKLTT